MMFCIQKVFCSIILLAHYQIVRSLTDWNKIDEVCGTSYSDRIVGGTKTSLGQVD